MIHVKKRHKVVNILSLSLLLVSTVLYF